MKNKQFYSFLTTVVLFVFITSLFTTVNVLADDATPPAPTEEPTLPFSEVPIVEETPTEMPITGIESGPTSLPAVNPAETPEVDTPAEVIESAPEGMDVVVLDENGNAMSMVTEEAAQIIMNGDPMWCPENVTPNTDFSNECTPPYSDFVSLIGELAGGGYAGNGTIYVAYDYTDTEGDINFDHSNGGLSTLGNLIIQGAWDFTNDQILDNDLTNQSNFGNNSLNIYNWIGNVTVNNIFISDALYDGLYIDTAGDVSLDYVDINNSNLSGAYIEAVGDVKVTNSNFTNNGAEGYYDNVNDVYEAQDGLYVETSGDVTLSNVYSAGNGANGATIFGSDVEIRGSVFENNGWGEDDGYGAYWNYDEYSDPNTYEYSEVFYGGNGLEIDASGDVTISDLEVYGNAGNGAEIYADGDVRIANSIFTYNGDLGFIDISNSFYDDSTQWVTQFDLDYEAGSGLIVEADGDITLADVIASENAYDGADLYSDSRNILITNSWFEYNGEGGGYFDCGCGYDTLEYYMDAFCDEADFDAPLLFNPCEDGGYIDIQGASFEYEVNVYGDVDNNYQNDYLIEQYSGTGLTAEADEGFVKLQNVEANNNAGDGAYIYGSTGVDITGGTFSNNGYQGSLYLGECAGMGEQNCVYVDGDSVDSAYAAYLGFNYGDGLHVDSDESITLYDVLANFNGNNGALTHADGSVFVESGEFSYNGQPIYIGGIGGLFGYFLYDQFGIEDSLIIPASEFDLEVSLFDGLGDDNGFSLWAGLNSGVGLEAEAESNIALADVSSVENAGDGADLEAEGAINISGSNFSGNGFGTNGFLYITEASVDGYDTEYFQTGMNNGNGLYMEAGGDLTLTDVTAADNALYGAEMYTDSNTFIEDSEFSGNGLYGYGTYEYYNYYAYYDQGLDEYVVIDESNESGEWYGSGMYIESDGNVTLKNVDANDNYQDGTEVYSNGGSIIVSCGYYNENGEYGIYAEGASLLELNGPEILDNGNSPDEYFFGGTIILSDDCTAPEEEEESKPTRPSRPIAIIPVTGDFDCTTFSGTLLLLPNGDNALFPCPIQDEGKIEVVKSDDLPGILPDGKNFLSAFTTFLFKDGKAQDASEELITVSFMIPEGADKEALSILFWNDNTEWIDLGGEVSDDGLYFQVSTKLVGTFVLVSK